VQGRLHFRPLKFAATEHQFSRNREKLQYADSLQLYGNLVMRRLGCTNLRSLMDRGNSEAFSLNITVIGFREIFQSIKLFGVGKFIDEFQIFKP
jgi:hypothetical protein